MTVRGDGAGPCPHCGRPLDGVIHRDPAVQRACLAKRRALADPRNAGLPAWFVAARESGLLATLTVIAVIALFVGPCLSR